MPPLTRLDRAKGQPLTLEQREAVGATLEAHYERNVSLRGLSRATGLSYGVVHRILKERGVKLRGRGERKRRTPNASPVTGS
ncbi:MAG TPA: helix-turn-helix domain-containing protein [Candidatus Saccharimonadia bacterium]|nr:helix-turn-helix domain-containing protein [Candidatus Saccharimonadia bacterium]